MAMPVSRSFHAPSAGFMERTQVIKETMLATRNTMNVTTAKTFPRTQINQAIVLLLTVPRYVDSSKCNED